MPPWSVFAVIGWLVLTSSTWSAPSIVRLPADIELPVLSDTLNSTVSTDAPPLSVVPPWNTDGVEIANWFVRFVLVSKKRIVADVNNTAAPPLFRTTMRTLMGLVWSVVKLGCDVLISTIATAGASSTITLSDIVTFVAYGRPFSVPST